MARLENAILRLAESREASSPPAKPEKKSKRISKYPAGHWSPEQVALRKANYYTLLATKGVKGENGKMMIPRGIYLKAKASGQID